MFNKNHPLTIHIDTFGFDQKNIALIRYALRHYEKYKLVLLNGSAQNKADITLFDMDANGAGEQWQAISTSIHSGENSSHAKPKGLIGLSYEPIELNQGINILKPLSSDKLFTAIESCLEKSEYTPLNEASVHSIDNHSDHSASSGHTIIELSESEAAMLSDEETSDDIEIVEHSSAGGTVTETKSTDTKNKVESIDVKVQNVQTEGLPTSKQTSSGSPNRVQESDEVLETQLREQVKEKAQPVLTQEMFFDSKKGILGVLRRIYRKKMAALIYLDDDKQGLFYVLPNTNSIYVMVSGGEIKKLCAQQTSVSYSELETHSFDATKIARPNRQFHLDYFLWLIALMTGRGRIPKAINAGHHQLGLKHWPNLTRYKSSSDFLRFAAFFTQTPTNFVLAQKLLNPPRGQLANFICACYALDILTVNKAEQKKDNEVKRLEKPSRYRKIIGQIFSRLFKSN